MISGQGTGSTSSIIDDTTILLPPSLRTNILQKLQARNYKEVTQFSHLEHAVEKVSCDYSRFKFSKTLKAIL